MYQAVEVTEVLANDQVRPLGWLLGVGAADRRRVVIQELDLGEGFRIIADRQTTQAVISNRRVIDINAATGVERNFRATRNAQVCRGLVEDGNLRIAVGDQATAATQLPGLDEDIGRGSIQLVGEVD